MRILIAGLAGALILSGCAVAPVEPRAVPDKEQAEPAPETSPAPAAAALVAQARQASRAGRYEAAVHDLERAIRIEPGNASLWHELARVRFQQGRYEQARQMAARSNALLASNAALKARNDRLIDRARDALGD